jgi:hypothetical protein
MTLEKKTSQTHLPWTRSIVLVPPKSTKEYETKKN